MGIAAGNQSGVEIQLGLFDAIVDLLLIDPIFLLGIVVIGILLAVIFKKDHSISKVKTSIILLVMYYYVCLLFTNIVGIPTLSEYIRLAQLDETFFNPNINLIPLNGGIGLSFILNIFLFIPLGFLCPLMSKTFECMRNTLLIGLSLSVLIEFSQLFTLYRATDINDLLTNVIGTMLGYLCFRVLVRLQLAKLQPNQQSKEMDYSKYLPIIIIMAAFVLGFFS